MTFEPNEMSIETDMMRDASKSYKNFMPPSLKASRPPIAAPAGGMGDLSRKKLSPLNRPTSATNRKGKKSK